MTQNERVNDLYNHLVASKKVSSKEEFAEKLEYNRSYISEIFSGATPVTRPLRTSIQNKFGISAKWIETGEGTMFVNPQDDPITLQDLDINATSSQISRLAAKLFKKIPDPMPEDIDTLKSISDRVLQLSREIEEEKKKRSKQ